MAIKGLLLRLEDYREHASAAEKKLVEMLVNDPDQVIGRSIHQLAEQIYASPATIIRLCKKLGCRGYREFQQILVYETALLKDSREISMREIIPTTSTEDIIQKVTQKNVEALEISKRLVEPGLIDQCVKLLDGCRMVQLFGLGSSLLVARDFYLKLLRVEKLCNICDDWHSQLLAARTMRPEDLAVVISYSGMTEEMVTCARTAKKNGAKLLVITRASDSKLAESADCVLPVAATELIMRSGAMSSRISQLNMIDILYVAYVNQHYERCMQRFPKTHIEKDNKEQKNAEFNDVDDGEQK